MCEVVETTNPVMRTHNGRTVKIINPKYREIGITNIDECLITDGSQRADWLIRLPQSKRLSSGTACLKLVELKGSNVLRAFSQLEATLNHPSLHGERHLVDECFIVSQINPSLTSMVQVEAAKFRLVQGVPIHVVSIATIDATPE
jgi:hypothetical protein